MRMVRTVAATFAGMMLVQSVAFAQAPATASIAAPSRDQWYWGINGGAMLFNAGFDSEVAVTAPTIGGEWFITRDRFAVRFMIQQAFFEEQTGIFDPTVPGAARPVDVKDWRRYSVEVYAMPRGDRFILPYAGAGISLNVLQSATPVGSFTSQESLEQVFLDIDQFSTRAALVFAAGAQANFGKSALFVQASGMPTGHAFLLSRSNYTAVIEAGVRYTFGSAIEKF